MIHRCFVWLHRWTGLLMAAFLVLVGLTGTLLAFRTKIDRLLNPELYAHVQPGQPPLDLATLAERAEALVPQARPGYFSIEDDQANIRLRFRTNPATGQPYHLNFDHLILDPYTGRELGRCCSSHSNWRVNFMAFIYKLHTSMAIGSVGEWILGVMAALAAQHGFTIDIRDFLPYRILVSLSGLVIAMLSVTGIYIWWRKRQARPPLRGDP